MRVSITTADAGVAAGTLDGAAQHPLGVPLHVAVDGEVQVRAVARLDGRVVAERDAVAAAHLVRRGAVGAGELAVERALEAGQRLVLADEADQVRRDVAGRVVAHRVATGVEALVALGLEVAEHPVGDGRGHPPGDVLEPAAAAGAQPVERLEVVDVELVREDRAIAGASSRVICGSATIIMPSTEVGQLDAVAVGDRAALGGQHDLHGALARPPSRRTPWGRCPGAGPAGRRRPRDHRDDHEAEAEPEHRVGAGARASCRALGVGARAQRVLRSPVSGLVDPFLPRRSVSRREVRSVSRAFVRSARVPLRLAGRLDDDRLGVERGRLLHRRRAGSARGWRACAGIGTPFTEPSASQEGRRATVAPCRARAPSPRRPAGRGGPRAPSGGSARGR